jgi:hypothetical protein
MSELRIPVWLLRNALSKKRTKHLRLFLTAKLLHNSRVKVAELIEELDIVPKTGKRLVGNIIKEGWANTDGKYLFLRSWNRMKYSKRGGLYITNSETLADTKKFEALCFTLALKRLYRSKRDPSANNGSATPKDLSSRYIALALQLKERRCAQLRSLAQKYGFLTIKRRYTILGKRNQFPALKKNLHGVPIFMIGKNSVTPDCSQITIKI